MCDTLKVPITIISFADITSCTTCWTGQWKYKVPYATWMELTEEGKVFKDVQQTIIFPARFGDAMPPECEIICIWYEGTKRILTYVIFNGQYPRVQLDCSFFYSYESQQECVGSHNQMALLQPHYHLNNNKYNLEIYLSKQSVKEHNSSLLLMIDSHHQQ